MWTLVSEVLQFVLPINNRPEEGRSVNDQLSCSLCSFTLSLWPVPWGMGTRDLFLEDCRFLFLIILFDASDVTKVYSPPG